MNNIPLTVGFEASMHFYPHLDGVLPGNGYYLDVASADRQVEVVDVGRFAVEISEEYLFVAVLTDYRIPIFLVVGVLHFV